jgi:alkanesulfonate monooxygenase SsuD/methylene tetrahydromethanopterin reductase-like flavin-dependent oxidoreductase (luciferase family)
MKQGFVFPFADQPPQVVAELAAAEAGFDGFFVWEPIWGTDAWVSLAAAATRTSTIRLGTMLSPLPRMRPWDLASKAASVDNLSGGRVILSVGLGAPDTGYDEFGEVSDRRIRAELLDESLTIVQGLWGGQPFAHEGKHYQLKPSTFVAPPPPVQQPRIPIWCPGVWPRPQSMDRALALDGLLPHVMDSEGNHQEVTVDHIREIREHAFRRRAAMGINAPYEIVIEGRTDPASAADRDRLGDWRSIGVTWWNEALWEVQSEPDGLDVVRPRVRAGPTAPAERGRPKPRS